MPKVMEAETWDHAVVFAFALILTVVGGISLLSWLFASLKWTGPLGVLKGGVVS